MSDSTPIVKVLPVDEDLNRRFQEAIADYVYPELVEALLAQRSGDSSVLVTSQVIQRVRDGVTALEDAARNGDQPAHLKAAARIAATGVLLIFSRLDCGSKRTKPAGSA